MGRGLGANGLWQTAGCLPEALDWTVEIVAQVLAGPGDQLSPANWSSAKVFTVKFFLPGMALWSASSRPRVGASRASPLYSWQDPMTARDDYYGVERWDVLPLISNQARTILDVGSGNGATMSIIKKKLPRARIVGVELNKSIAASSGDLVIVGDIQATELREELAALGEGFDCILALDVLEHLIDPWEVLCYLKTLLNPGGYVLISLPNLSNFKSLLPLLFLNRFEYQDAGILDRTHLRFFTRREAIDLVEKCGLKLRDIIPTGPVSRKGVVSRAGLLAYAIYCLSFGRLERFVAHQYVLRASLA